MTHPRVLCLGEILFDCLANQPERSLEEVESWTSYPGGAPANVACGLTKLGTPAGFVGCVGQDEQGEALVQLLQTLGVDSSGVQRHPTAPTRKIYVLRSATGDRCFAGFGDLDTTEFADTYLQADQLPTELFENADFLVIGTLEMAYPESRAATERALQLAEQHYVKTVVDVNWRPMFWPQPDEALPVIQTLLKRADFIKLSDDEAKWLFGTTDPGAIAHRLGNTEGVLVTAGEKGCTYCLGENEDHVPAFEVEAEDTTGAGDSFLSGFLHQIAQFGLHQLADPIAAKKVITYASAVGALTTTRPGAIAAQPTPAEVEAFLYLQQQLPK